MSYFLRVLIVVDSFPLGGGTRFFRLVFGVSTGSRSGMCVGLVQL